MIDLVYIDNFKFNKDKIYNVMEHDNYIQNWLASL